VKSADTMVSFSVSALAISLEEKLLAKYNKYCYLFWHGKASSSFFTSRGYTVCGNSGGHTIGPISN
jgi:hypothetical protein